MAIHPLIVGGQGTYQNGCFYTEYPDRELCLDYLRCVGRSAKERGYTHIICSGGSTQKKTKNLSEAASIVHYWEESGSQPDENITVVLDEVSLDSSENIIFGLMALRLKEKNEQLGRIGFYSLWQFKKPRMNGLACQLGIQERFYFHAYTDADKANAGDLAKAGEKAQLTKMVETDDFVLQNKDEEWEEKKLDRYVGVNYPDRDNALRNVFPKTFESLDELKKDKVSELASYQPELSIKEAVNSLRKNKIETLKKSFAKEVLRERDV